MESESGVCEEGRGVRLSKVFRSKADRARKRNGASMSKKRHGV